MDREVGTFAPSAGPQGAAAAPLRRHQRHGLQPRETRRRPGSRTSPGPGPGVHGTVTSLSIHAQAVVQPEARTRQAGAGGLGLRQSPGESWPPSRIQTRTC